MYCEFYNKNNLCQCLQTDLKTIEGYLNRVEKSLILKKNITKLIIYYCDNSIGYYSDETKKITIIL